MYKYVIIDDELLTRKGTIEKLAPVANILQCTGEAEDGEQGLQLIEAVHPDLVITDMKMPVMGGLEATREIRKFDTETPIIAVTANAFEFDREEAMRAGCNTFITKPLNKKELKEVLGD